MQHHLRLVGLRLSSGGFAARQQVAFGRQVDCGRRGQPVNPVDVSVT